MSDLTSIRYQTPDEWCREKNVTVMDPDGWRSGFSKRSKAKSWSKKISEKEFNARVCRSTIMFSSNVMLETEKIKEQEQQDQKP